MPNQPLRGAIVLIVEDDVDTRESLTELIRHALGWDVVTAANGVEALRIIDSGARFDLMFSDIMMPGMDGLSLTNEVRKRRPQLPIVLATGLPTAIDWGVERGAIALVKPYTFDQLSAVFHDQLRADQRAS